MPISGPPESPWHASLPFWPPAHSMFDVTGYGFRADSHRLVDTTVTFTWTQIKNVSALGGNQGTCCKRPANWELPSLCIPQPATVIGFLSFANLNKNKGMLLFKILPEPKVRPWQADWSEVKWVGRLCQLPQCNV